jgi:endonuclease/exonuclease/phosphatase family metal-dependent hydrolase
MKLITWNVQWCRGCDGRVDPSRIVEHARALADFDVLCLQEVAHNFPGRQQRRRSVSRARPPAAGISRGRGRRR